MSYEIQYDICAIVICTILVIIYKMRARYISDTNKIFVSIISVNLFASIFDLISCYTIAYYKIVPVGLNYLVNILYLFSYNYLLILFLFYIWKKAKMQKGDLFIRTYIWVNTIAYIIMIFGTPLHHGVFYISESGYHHGPLFAVLFVLSFLSLIIESIIFIIAGRNFNLYQRIYSIMLIFFMIGSVAVTIIIPNALAGQFGISVILYFVYVTYENPAYYTYLDTQCLNKNAFLEDFDKHKKDRMIILHNTDYDYREQNTEYQTHEYYKRRIADYFGQNFSKSAYNFQDDKYGILFEDDEAVDIQAIIDGINKHLINVNITINAYTLEGLKNYTAREVCNLIRIVNKSCNRNETAEMIASIKDSVRENNQILMSINRAIENNSFMVNYQPIYNIATGEFDSAEALIRLNDPEFGNINPESLIIVAEQHGYIDKIGDLVFEKTCKFYAENNLDSKGIHYIEVNLSPRQCLRPNLAKVYKGILDKYKLKPENMNLEITETADFANNEMVFENINEFNKYGFKLSLDDFGSGYASPNYVIQFPFDCIKVDREILWGAMSEPVAKSILVGLLSMVHTLGKKSIVEGAETKEMVELLIESNADYIQGYYFSKPLTEEAFLEFIK